MLLLMLLNCRLRQMAEVGVEAAAAADADEVEQVAGTVEEEEAEEMALGIEFRLP